MRTNNPAIHEFIVGIYKAEGTQKFTPTSATVNGVKGRIWIKRRLTDGAWLHEGKQHVRKAACEVEVAAAFLPADHDAAVTYWETA